MEQILSELCSELHNWFEDRGKGYFGTFAIEGGRLSLPNIKEGQCVRIVGSTFNDGVHMYPFYDLSDETFSGSCRAMNIPPEVMEFAADLERAREGQGASGSVFAPFTSESFGGYSYTKATDKNGVPLDWRTLAAKRLNKWRKLP